MRTTLLALILIATAATASAQTENAPPAPKDRAVDVSGAELDAAAKDLLAKGLITKRMLEGGIFSINVRHIRGSEAVLQHGRITEVWVVREGEGTVWTGGTLVGGTPGAGPGELRGTAIQGGHERQIKAGDIVFIPPGVPHGIKKTDAITYLNIRFELRQP
jgi:mannose-6-phosphate isomerase-like protein (cupin superfamily)